MIHGALQNVRRLILRVARVCRDQQVQRGYPTVVLEADVVLEEKSVPLPGQQHVVVSIETTLRWLPRLERGQRRNCRELRREGFLAAEGAAHAPHLDRHRVRGLSENASNEVLDRRRILGCTVDVHIARLLRYCQRRLRFEVEVLLSAAPHAASQPMASTFQRRQGVSSLEGLRLAHIGLSPQGFFDGQQRRQIVVVHACEADRTARLQV